MGDSIENLPQVKAGNIYCSSLIYQASPLIIEGYQLG